MEIAPRAEEMAAEKEMACCVRSYHIYKDIWAAVIREVLVCSTEPSYWNSGIGPEDRWYVYIKSLYYSKSVQLS